MYLSVYIATAHRKTVNYIPEHSGSPMAGKPYRFLARFY